MTWWSNVVQFADGAGVVLGTLGIMFGGLWWLISRYNRRSAKLAAEIKYEVRMEGAGERGRLESLERDVEALKGEVGELDERVEVGFQSIDREIATLGRALETVARQSDVATLARDVAGLSSAQHATGRQVTMLYEATLRREEGKKS